MILNKDTSQLTLFLTTACNLHCSYCYEKNKTNDAMSFETAIRWIKNGLTQDCASFLNIYLFGGEPLLQFPLIQKICDWTWIQQWKRKYAFIVQTNGTLLDDIMKEWFTSHRNDIRMCLSLDGDRDTHNKNRDNSFDKIDLPYFLDNWPLQPIKMTISQSNIDSLAHNIIWIQEKGFRIRGCNFAIGEVEYDDIFFLRVSDQLRQLADYYISHPSMELAPIINLPLFLLSAKKRPERISCSMGSNKLIVVNTDGSTSPCSFFSNSSINKMQYGKLSHTLNCINYRNIECYKTCPFFPICDICYGENYNSTSDIYKVSLNKCRLMKIRLAASMYVQGSLIAQKKKVTYEDQLTIDTIKKYQKQLKIN